MPILPPRLGFKMMSNAPTFFRDFATNKTLDHGFGPSITFTRTGTATYFDSNGTLTTATANTPRFDHDPVTLASRGLLIEEGRTNSIANSQCTGAVAGTAGTAPTGWSISGNANGLTRTIATGSINGFSYIDVTFSGTVTGGPINIALEPQSTNAGYTAGSGQTWTGSFYTSILSGSIPSGASFALITRGRKSDNTASEDGTLVIAPTASLTRYSVTRTLNSADTARVTLDIRVNSVPNGASVNFTLRIAAPQLEQGAFATSYIPTTSAAVARGADVASVTSASATLNSNEGTLFYEGSRYVVPTSNYGVDFLRLSGSGSSAITLQSGFAIPAQQRLLVIDSSNVTVVNCFFESAIANTVYRLAGVYRVNDFIAYQNGVASASGTSGSGWASLDTIRIGYNGSAGQINGHIRKVGYWPRRLSNANLQAMTA